MKRSLSWSSGSTHYPVFYKEVISGGRRQEIQSVNVNDKRRLIIFPGSAKGENNDTSSKNATKSVLSLMNYHKIDTSKITLYTATYYHPYPSSRTRENIDALAAEPSSFSSPDADVIARSLLPLIAKNISHDGEKVYGEKLPIDEVKENFSRTTFLGKSKGTLIIRELENRLARHMLEDFGYTKSEVSESLKELFSVGIANLLMVDGENRRSSGVCFTSISDQSAVKYFSKFENIPHSSSDKFDLLSFQKGNFVLYICDIPKELKLLNDQGKEFEHNDPTGHSFLSYIGVRSDGKNAIPLAIAECLGFGVNRDVGYF
ncbi:MAG: hypothetical protein ACJAZX_001117 [Rickettsiales bacterium]|jgi:hypothetical protein